MTWRSTAAAATIAAIIWLAVWLSGGLASRAAQAGGDAVARFRLGIDPAAVTEIRIETPAGGEPVRTVRARRTEPGDAAHAVSPWLVSRTSGEAGLEWAGDAGAIRAVVRLLAGLRIPEREDGPRETAAERAWALEITEGGRTTAVITAAGPPLVGRVPVTVRTEIGAGRSGWLEVESLAAIGVPADGGGGDGRGAAWLDRSLLGSPGGVATNLRVEPRDGQTGPIEFGRELGVWRLVEPGLDVRVGQERVEELLRALRGVRAEAVIGASAGDESGVLRVEIAGRSGAGEVRRAVILRERAGVGGQALHGRASVAAEAAGAGAGFAATAAVIIDGGTVPPIEVGVAAYAETRVVPWSPEETWAVGVDGSRFERGVDGWRRAGGAPATRGETLAIDATLRTLAETGGVQLAIDPGPPPEEAAGLTIERLGGGRDGVLTATAWLDRGSLLRVQAGDARWSWTTRPRGAAWLIEQLPRITAGAGGDASGPGLDANTR